LRSRPHGTATPNHPTKGPLVTTGAHIRHQTAPNPDGCRWCGYDKPHGWQYLPGKGSHQWEQPTNAQRLARMQARRNARKATT